jgi:undecaprenyl-diphosphatase
MLSFHRPVPRVVDWVLLALPWLGTNLTLMPILTAVSLWLWRRRGRGELALQIMITVAGSLFMNAVLKALFDRPRPELWPHRGQYAWAAYPSGHAIVGVSVILTIALMLHRERGWRWPFVAACVLLTISLYSRLYLGVHWPTDVIGGLLLGLAWLIATQHAFSHFRERDPAAHRSSRGQTRSSTTGSPDLTPSQHP